LKKKNLLKNPLFYGSYILVIFLSLHAAHIYNTGEINIVKIVTKLIDKTAKEPFDINVNIANVKFTVVILGCLSITWLYLRLTEKNYMTGKECGSARWATSSEGRKLADKNFKNNIILTNTERLSLAKYKIKKNHNVLIVGGSGTGKSRNFVIPNLMQLNCSFAVTSPKSELLKSTGKMFEEAGYKIKVLNLIELEHSNSYNPFVYLREDKDVLKLINNLMKNTSPAGNRNVDSFWEKAEAALLQALVYYVFYEADDAEKDFTLIMDLLASAKTKEDDEDFESDLDILFKTLNERKPGHIACKQYGIFKQAAGKTAKSILVSLGVRLAIFNTDALRRLVMVDNIELGRLGEEKTILYIVIPEQDTTYNFLVAMIYNQLFDTLYYKADFEYDGQLPVKVNFLLDEFANIGQIPEFQKVISTMRSRNIAVSVVIQDLAQIKSAYKESWETIVANCDSFLFLGGSDQSTLEYISRALGKQTINVLSHGRTRGKSSGSSINDSTKPRELMTPDEISRMPDDKCILMVRGMRPFYSDKFKLQKHPEYKSLGVDGKNIFDFRKIKTHGYDENERDDNYKFVAKDLVFDDVDNLEYEYEWELEDEEAI